MSEETLDPSKLLSTLSECGVDFVLVGAFAVGAHAEARATGDVDVMVPIGDEENKEAIERALKELRARRLSAQAGGIDPTAGDPYPTLMFMTRFGKLDILYKPDGSEPFQAIKRRSVMTTVGGKPVAVAGKDDLIRMKLAAGRPDDFADVANLTAGARGIERHVSVTLRLARGVDAAWATDYAGSRVDMFDPGGRVWADAGWMKIDVHRSDLTDAQIEDWAQALADRLHGAEVLAEAEPDVQIEPA